MIHLNYDDISPFTGEKRLIIERDAANDIAYKMCMDTGYRTIESVWNINNMEVIEQLETNMPQAVLNSKHIAENGDIWYRAYYHNQYAIIVPNKVDDKLQWTVYPLKHVAATDPHDIAIPIEAVHEGNQVVVVYYCQYDDANQLTFDINKFEQAFDAFYAVTYQRDGAVGGSDVSGSTNQHQ